MENTTNMLELEEFPKPLEEQTPEVKTPQKPKKYDYFTMLLYTDNPRHLQVIVDIRAGKYPDATAILHHLDPKPLEEQTPEDPYKKPHCHVVYRFPYKARKTAMETLFPDIESNLIKGVTEPVAIYRYLIHQDDPSKHRYSPNDVFGNTERFYHYYHNNTRLTECEAVPMILDILDDWDYCQGKPTYSKVIRICAEMGLYGYLRQGGALLSQVIKETIDEYNREHSDSRWLEENYIQTHQADEIWKLNSALKSANNTIEQYKKLIK